MHEFFLYKRLYVKELRQFLKGYSHCSFGNVISLNSRFGRIVLDFGSDIAHCKIQLKRKSGNGVFNLISGKKSNSHRVLSQVSQNVAVDLSKGKFEIVRGTRGIGIVEILSVELYKKREVHPDWVSIFDNAVSYSGINQRPDGVFAARGAKIVADQVFDLKTQPPNSYKIDGNTITFTYPCRLLNLDILSEPQVIGEVLNADFSDSIVVLEDPKPASVTPSVLAPAPAPVSAPIVENQVITAAANNIRTSFKSYDSKLWSERLQQYRVDVINDPDLSFCNLYDPSLTKKVYVEEFSENLDLRKCQAVYKNRVVFTPSLKNQFQFSGIGIVSHLVGRYLPLNSSIYGERKKCVFYLNKDQDFTERLVKEWQPSLGKLFVLGFDFKNDSVEGISDILPLNDIAKLVCDSYACIDISANHHYISSFCELYLGYFTRVITNNHRYIGQNNCLMLSNSDEILIEDVLMRVRQVGVSNFSACQAIGKEHIEEEIKKSFLILGSK